MRTDENGWNGTEQKGLKKGTDCQFFKSFFHGKMKTVMYTVHVCTCTFVYRKSAPVVQTGRLSPARPVRLLCMPMNKYCICTHVYISCHLFQFLMILQHRTCQS